jgi:hypothetical protein
MQRCKITSRPEHGEFYLGSVLPESNNPMSNLSLLICGFKPIISIPSMEFELLFL